MAAKKPAVYPMPPANADLPTTWAFLERGVDNIMTKPNEVSYSDHMALCTVSYNYCTSSKMHWGGKTLGMAGRVEGNIMASELYNNLTRYLVTHLGTLKDSSESLQDEALLQYYAREWDRYTAGASCINRSFTYLNRHWVKRERDEGRRGLYPVYTLALVQWKNNFFIHIQNENAKLAGAILRLIERERNGQEIDQGLVKKVLDSFVSLGLDEADINKAHLDVYKEHFELPFLEATEEYYQLESEAFLAENTISDYLKKVEEWLREEEDRVERYLNTNTRKPLISKCEHVLIREHSKLMYESFYSVLDHDMDEDLQRMYELLARVPDGLEPLRDS